MELTQKCKSRKHNFTFHDDFLGFSWLGKSGFGYIEIPYAELPDKVSIYTEQNQWLRNFGYFCCLISVIEMIYAINMEMSFSELNIWLIIGIGCIISAQLSRKEYSVFATEQGCIQVMHDHQHDQIIHLLACKRKEQLLLWYSDVDPGSDLEFEIKKFQWLFRQGLITMEETEQKIAQAYRIFTVSGLHHDVCLN